MAACTPKEVVAICHRLEVAARRGSLSGFDRALALKQLRRIRRDGVAARGFVPLGEGRAIGGDVDAAVLRTSLERAVAALAPADRDAVAGLQLQLREGVARDRVRAVRRLADLVRLGLRGPLAERVVTDLCETIRLGGAAARVAVVALGRVHTPARSVPIRQALELAAKSEDAGLRVAAAKVERMIRGW